MINIFFSQFITDYDLYTLSHAANVMEVDRIQNNSSHTAIACINICGSVFRPLLQIFYFSNGNILVKTNTVILIMFFSVYLVLHKTICIL